MLLYLSFFFLCHTSHHTNALRPFARATYMMEDLSSALFIALSHAITSGGDTRTVMTSEICPSTISPHLRRGDCETARFHHKDMCEH